MQTWKYLQHCKHCKEMFCLPKILSQLGVSQDLKYLIFVKMILNEQGVIQRTIFNSNTDLSRDVFDSKGFQRNGWRRNNKYISAEGWDVLHMHNFDLQVRRLYSICYTLPVLFLKPTNHGQATCGTTYDIRGWNTCWATFSLAPSPQRSWLLLCGNGIERECRGCPRHRGSSSLECRSYRDFTSSVKWREWHLLKSRTQCAFAWVKSVAS